MRIRSHLDEKGEPWFLAKDVCAVLDHSNYRMALQMLDDDEKGVSKVYTLGGEQEMLTISESGLYSLIIRSNKPEARRFRKWLTSEVLPTIRKTGAYTLTYADRLVLDRIPELTKRTVVKSLSDVAVNNPERAKTLEADIVRMCLMLASSSVVSAPGDSTPEPPLVATFWQTYELLEQAGHKLNHSASPSRIAVNLPEFVKLSRDEGCYSFDRAELCRLLPLSRKYPLLAPRKNIRGKANGKTIRCWLFCNETEVS